MDMIDLEQLRKDMEAGTKTPWTFKTVKTSCGVCHKIGPFKYNNGKETSACVYEDYPWTTPHSLSEPEANARRIARVPQLEREYIALREAADALADACKMSQHQFTRPIAPKGHMDATKEKLSEALTAYQEALGGRDT